MNPIVPEQILDIFDVAVSCFITADPKSPKNNPLPVLSLSKNILSGFMSLCMKPA
jgi:hypothetical protein